MRFLTISNLYPRPDKPTLGMFNYQLFSEFVALGHTVQNVCPVPEWRVWRWSAIRQWALPNDRIPTRYFPYLHIPLVGRNFAHVLASVTGFQGDRVTGREAPDVILGSWLYPDGVLAARVAKEAGKPLWLMALGSDTYHLNSPARRRIVLDACQQAERIVCVAQHLAQRLIDAGVDPAKVHVVPNGVDTSRFHPVPVADARIRLSGSSGEAARRLTTWGNRPLVLFVGNLVPVKGPDIMLRAFMQLQGHEQIDDRPKTIDKRQESNVYGPMSIRYPPSAPHLVFIGSGPMERTLRADAKRWGIADRVTFAGSRPHDELPLWMNVASVLCLTSRSEGMPNVLLEAIACGLPVVATDVGACREMLEGKTDACLVPQNRPEELSAAVRRLLGSPPPQTSPRLQPIRSWRDMATDICVLIRRATA
jgi:glycosyltransferase involved in cell wall biosynthesis